MNRDIAGVYLLKSHVKAYTRADGTAVQEHDDSRQKKTTLAHLKKHPMWSESDYRYFKGKGYSHEEIKAFWDRDHKEGNAPMIHKPVPNYVGVIADPNFYKKSYSQQLATLAKSIRARNVAHTEGE